MTTIVGCAVDGTIYIGADTTTNVYERPIANGAEKILTVPTASGTIILAVCGAGGLVGELAAHLPGILADFPAELDDPQPWAHSVAAVITKIAVTAGLVEDGKLDGHVLLGWRGRLWTITHSMAIPHRDGRAALGSGEGPALGALDAFLELGVNPAEAVHRAAVIGCQRDRYSGPPIQMVCLPPPAEPVSAGGGDAGE